ncbi:hypothetical protein EMCRGX_G013670 [Ephydatia muelleri]
MAEQNVTVAIVGNGPCGKTQFIKTWLTNVFRTEVDPTIQDDYHANWVVDGTPVSLLFFDTAGFDYIVDDEEGYESVRNAWLPEIKQHCPKIPWLLLGLKADLRFSSEQYIELRRRARLTQQERACIPEQAARDMAKELGAVGYFECSALAQNGLNNVMESAVRAALNRSRHTSNGKRFNWFRKRRTTDTTSEPAIPPPPTLPENEKAPLINVSTSTLPADWKKLVNCEDHSDVIFLLGPKVYHAHRPN